MTMTKLKNSTATRLRQFVLTRKTLLAALTMMTIIQVGLSVYFPVLIGGAIDQVALIDHTLIARLVPILVSMGIVIILNMILQWLNPQLVNQLVHHLMAQLREDVMSKVHHLPLSQVDRISTGDLVARITSDIDVLGDGLIMLFNQFFMGVLTIIFTIISMGMIDAIMMLVVIVLTPISIWIARFIAKKSYLYYQKQAALRSKQTEHVEENVSQLTLLQLSNATNQIYRQFVEINETFSIFSLKATFFSSTINPSTRFVNALIYALLIVIGTLRIINGKFTVGQLTTFLNYATQYTKPFNDISSVLSEIQGSLASATRIFGVIDMQEEQQTGHQTVRESVQGDVTFEHVNFAYVANRPLIQDLNLAVKSGQKVAIVGPTGAGKSTLINLLMHFYELNAGRILIDGVAINDLTRESLREQMGMVLQETWLKSGTIFDNIAYGQTNATYEEVVEAAKKANAHEFIEKLAKGYETELDEGGVNLSIGQQQLICIARLFLNVPTILILDEATSSIDTRTEILIQRAFDSLMADRTTFIIAHRLSTIQSADLILVMDKGNIVEQGTHASLMASQGLYYKMQSAQGVMMSSN